MVKKRSVEMSILWIGKRIRRINDSPKHLHLNPWKLDMLNYMAKED
jgi:hypothetical protein